MTVAPTPVLIDYLCARQEAVDYVDKLIVPRFLSVITVAERSAGVRDGTERTTLDTFISAFSIVMWSEFFRLSWYNMVCC